MLFSLRAYFWRWTSSSWYSYHLDGFAGFAVSIILAQPLYPSSWSFLTCWPSSTSALPEVELRLTSLTADLSDAARLDVVILVGVCFRVLCLRFRRVWTACRPKALLLCIETTTRNPKEVGLFGYKCWYREQSGLPGTTFFQSVKLGHSAQNTRFV